MAMSQRDFNNLLDYAMQTAEMRLQLRRQLQVEREYENALAEIERYKVIAQELAGRVFGGVLYPSESAWRRRMERECYFNGLLPEDEPRNFKKWMKERNP